MNATFKNTSRLRPMCRCFLTSKTNNSEKRVCGLEITPQSVVRNWSDHATHVIISVECPEATGVPEKKNRRIKCCYCQK